MTTFLCSARTQTQKHKCGPSNRGHPSWSAESIFILNNRGPYQRYINIKMTRVKRKSDQRRRAIVAAACAAVTASHRLLLIQNERLKYLEMRRGEKVVICISFYLKLHILLSRLERQEEKRNRLVVFWMGANAEEWKCRKYQNQRGEEL